MKFLISGVKNILRLTYNVTPDPFFNKFANTNDKTNDDKTNDDKTNNNFNLLENNFNNNYTSFYSNY